MGIEERYRKEAVKVRQCAESCGRKAGDVTLLAVSKTVGIEQTGEAIYAGASNLGENRPDALVQKHAAYPNVRWHFIGNIQSRKIDEIVNSATLIHSLYQLKHANKINECAAKRGKIQDVLIEVNVSGEESKSGCTPDEALGLIKEIEDLPNVRVRGLMTMAPQGDLQVARKCFDDLVSLFNDIKSNLSAENAKVFTEISAGMSEDWEEAIAAGSTIVRIGRAIFSDAFA